MAALLSPPLMQVSFSPYRKVVSEPMKPHGDAAQLAVKPGEYQWGAFGDARADYVHACRM